MANQANEDELKNEILTKFKHGYKLAPDDYIENCTNVVIRTEKIKLLDEVIHQSTVNLKSAKAVAGWAEIRKEQLEAKPMTNYNERLEEEVGE